MGKSFIFWYQKEELGIRNTEPTNGGSGQGDAWRDNNWAPCGTAWWGDGCSMSLWSLQIAMPYAVQLGERLPLPPWPQGRTTEPSPCSHPGSPAASTQDTGELTPAHSTDGEDNSVPWVPFPPAPKISLTDLSCLQGQHSTVLQPEMGLLQEQLQVFYWCGCFPSGSIRSLQSFICLGPSQLRDSQCASFFHLHKDGTWINTPRDSALCEWGTAFI